MVRTEGSGSTLRDLRASWIASAHPREHAEVFQRNFFGH
jgi:hypothetical protein